MKIFLVAGEASGDLHGGHLANALKAIHPSIEMRGWGGEKMENAGVRITKHYRELAFMGFVEVLLNLRTIKQNFATIKEQILEFQPDKIIFIDYPGFNLRLAPWAKEHGIETHYYISPTIWAWKEGRVHDIKKYIDAMYCILPFEPAVYAKHQYTAHFVGHPLLDDWALNQKTTAPTHDFILLAPGSRKQELKKILPVFVSVAHPFKSEKFIIAGAPGLSQKDYDNVIGVWPDNIEIKFGQTPELMRNAKAGLIASGTATLEAALRGCPIAVAYKANPISIFLAKILVKIKWISLVNLILNKEEVKELIQEKMTVASLTQALKELLSPEGKDKAKKIQDDLLQKLGGPGASKNVAQLVLNHGKV
ncbi:MAG: Lipid-A-disaccharide synthase [Bacteroidota bacterium]